MFLQKLISLILFLSLVSCGSGDNNTEQSAAENKASTELPAGVQKLALTGNGRLNAYITLDGNNANRTAMSINPAGAGTASLVLPGLTRAVHNITITYEYTLDGLTYVLATASKTIDLSSGSASLNFTAIDYETDGFDDDSDGSSNVAELKSNTDPRDSSESPLLAFTSGFFVNIGENTTATGYQAAATAADNNTITFSLSGRDQDLFDIDAITGILRFKDAPDFENPGDIDQNNIYEVDIEANAVTREGTTALLARSVFITILDVAEDPNARPFITVWRTDNPSSITDDNQVKIGTIGAGYNYSVDWGDGSTDANLTGDVIHTYAEPGIYTISINGAFPRIFFDSVDSNNFDALKILSIEQWGDIEWQSMNQAFSFCSQLVGNAKDTPDLSQVRDMNQMFLDAADFNQDINNWNVSTVTNMTEMFRQADAFNQNLNNWDVSAVTKMNSMFDEARSFNQDLSEWDVSAVTDMSFMFSLAISFNQNISNWDVSSVTNMSGMFFIASLFDQDLSSWDVSAVTDMIDMFRSLSTVNYDALLSGWSKLNNLQSNVEFGAENALYSSSSQAARDILTNTFGWIIIDAGIVPP